MWFLSLEGAVCAYLCLTWAGKVSTLDIFSLMCLPQGWLWNSWSSFIPVSLLSVQNMKTLIYWTAYFLKFKILGTGVISWTQLHWTRTPRKVTNFKLSNLNSWKLHRTRYRLCTIAACNLTREGASEWGLDWLGYADKNAVMTPELPSVSLSSPCCKDRNWE